jgi:hypothetical protein
MYARWKPAIFDLRKKNEELDKRIVELRRLPMSPN